MTHLTKLLCSISLLLGFLGMSQAQAQHKSEGDSLQQYIEKLALLAPAQALKSAVKLQQKALAGNDSLRLGYGYLLEGSVQTKFYNFPEAESALSRALDVFRDQRFSSGIQHAYQEAGRVAYLRGHHYRGLNLLEKALRQSADSSLPSFALAHHYLAGVKLALNQAEAALQHSRRALVLSQRYNRGKIEGSAYNRLAEIYVALGEKAKARKNLDNALITNHAYGNHHEEAKSYGLKSAMEAEEHRWQSALTLLGQAIVLEDKDPPSPLLIELMLQKSALLLSIDSLEASEEWARRAEVLYQQHDYLQQLKVDLHRQLAEIYLARGDSGEALAHLLHYQNASDSIREFDLSKILLQRHLEQKSARNQLLEVSNKNQGLQLSRSRIMLILATIVILTAILAIFGLTRTMRRRKKYNRLLEQRNREQSERHREIEQLHEELTAKNKDLLELDEAKTKVFSVLTHDLRQPINQIRSVLELLEADQLPEEDRSHIVQQLKQSLDNSSDALENLLLWSKKQLKGIKTRVVDVHLLPQVWQLESHLKPSLEAKNLQLKIDIPDFLKIQADMDQLDICLKNLVSNAIKFSNIGESIVIAAREEKDYKVVEVRDHGVGMTPEQLQKINTSENGFTTMGTMNEKGTGLGILITKDFMREQNGKLRVESKPGQGSSFQLLFPVQNELAEKRS